MVHLVTMLEAADDQSEVQCVQSPVQVQWKCYYDHLLSGDMFVIRHWSCIYRVTRNWNNQNYVSLSDIYKSGVTNFVIYASPSPLFKKRDQKSKDAIVG